MPLKALSEVSRASVKAFPLSRWTWGRNYKNVARLNVTFLPCSPPPKYSFDIQFLKHIHICIHTYSTREFVFPFEIVKPFIIIRRRFKPRWYTLLISLSLSLSLFFHPSCTRHKKLGRTKKRNQIWINRRKKNYCPITLPRATPYESIRGGGMHDEVD